MRVRKLELERFMLFDCATVELPESGLVLVTGDNGEGKSSIVEAIASACYGKTLRGTPWFREGAETTVSATLVDGVKITRRRTPGGKTHLTVEGAPDFDNATKAQPFVEQHVGTLDVWRKTCVFSSSAVEGANLTGSTDKDRKLFLEAVLGLDKFDSAYERCREDLNKAKHAVELCARDLDAARVRKAHEEQRMYEAAEARGLIEVPAPPVHPGTRPVVQDAEKTEAEIEALQEDLRDLRSQRGGLLSSDAAHVERVRSLQKRVAELQRSICPTCHRPFDNAHAREQAEHDLENAQKARVASKQDADSECAMLDEQIAEIEEDIVSLRGLHASASESVREFDRKLEAYKQAKEARKRAMLARESLDARVADASAKSAKSAGEVAEFAATLKRREQTLNVLEVVTRVLGYQGVRAQVLARTLAGVSSVANKWLVRIGSSLSIKLKPYSEKKTGGFSDAISIDVTGAGAGHGYKACSNGQRRRIDVALLLALATMASAVRGVEGSTLFFDEVFDALDQKGTEGVAQALDELSRDRCVVVISHSSALERALIPAVHVHVEGGQVFEL